MRDKRCGDKVTVDLSHIVDLYVNKEMSCAEIARITPYTAMTISRRLKSLGVLRNRSDSSFIKNRKFKKSFDTALIIRLYQEDNKTLIELAKMFKSSKGRMAKILKENHVKIRKGVRGHSHNYKGFVLNKGYKFITVSKSHKFFCMSIKAKGKSYGRLAEHRLVMATYLGRPLDKWEVVHHKNHNRLDNRIENLELVVKPCEHLSETIMYECELRKYKKLYVEALDKIKVLESGK